MDFLQAAFLATLQGITEFLPISSSAHLVFVPQLFGWQDQGVVFDIAVHVGTLIAVILYFWRQLWRMLAALIGLRGSWTKPTPKNAHVRADIALIFKLGLAMLPLVVLALLLKNHLDAFTRAIPVLATTSIIFGVLLWKIDIKRPTHNRALHHISWRESLIFGAMQALALIPGTSRSGICVTAGRMLGYSREVSGTFASLLAIPTILIAAFYSATKVNIIGLNWQSDAALLATATIIAAIVALLGIHILVKWLARIGYFPFMLYRVVLGLSLWVWFLN